MIADGVTMNRETVRLMPSEEMGTKTIFCQDGAQESQTATLG
jgi:hypothetical protein